MDFEKLLKPYSENGRTLEGQVLWLSKKGFQPVVIEKAIQGIYKRLEGGEAFQDGHALDRALFDLASELAKIEASLLIKNLDRFVEGGRFKKAWAALRGKL